MKLFSMRIDPFTAIRLFDSALCTGTRNLSCALTQAGLCPMRQEIEPPPPSKDGVNRLRSQRLNTVYFTSRTPSIIQTNADNISNLRPLGPGMPRMRTLIFCFFCKEEGIEAAARQLAHLAFRVV